MFRKHNPIHWVQKHMLPHQHPQTPATTTEGTSPRPELTSARQKSLNRIVADYEHTQALMVETLLIMGNPEMKVYYAALVAALHSLFVAAAASASTYIDINTSERTGYITATVEEISTPSPILNALIHPLVVMMLSSNKLKRQSLLQAANQWSTVFNLYNVPDQLARYYIRYHRKHHLSFATSTLASPKAPVPDVAQQDFEKIFEMITTNEPFSSSENIAQEIYTRVTENEAIQEPLQPIASDRDCLSGKQSRNEILKAQLSEALSIAVHDYQQRTRNCIGIWHGGRASRQNARSLHALVDKELNEQLSHLISYLRSSPQHSSLTTCSLAGHLVRALSNTLLVEENAADKAVDRPSFFVCHSGKQEIKSDSQKIIGRLQELHQQHCVSSPLPEEKVISWVSKRYL